MRHITDDKQLNPADYGLPKRLVLIARDDNHIVIRIDRKSRIIMKDGETILGHATTLKSKLPDTTVSVETTAPVCSKTRGYLSDKGLQIHEV